MVTIAELIATLLGRIFSVSVIRWIALKTVLTTLFVVVLPIVLNNFLSYLIDISVNILNKVMQNLGVININFTGLATYILNNIYFTQWFSVILSAIAMKLVLKTIPFLNK